MPDQAIRPASIGAPNRVWQGETYYGLPSIKQSPWDWKVSVYIFIAGLAGSAQVIGTAADLVGGMSARGTVRRARHLALLGPAIGAPLLVADLHTPKRFYNMLRIFRPTSPMSIGTYVLSSFSVFSVAAAVADDERFRIASRLAGIAAAISGAGMSVYTAALLASTSTPAWASSPRLLAARFAASSVSTAAAALSLAEQADSGPGQIRQALGQLTALSTTVELGTALIERSQKDDRTRDPLADAMHMGAVVFGAVAPLACLALRRRSPIASTVASVGVLLGGILMRHAVLSAGNRTAQKPAAYFRFASPASRRRSR